MPECALSTVVNTQNARAWSAANKDILFVSEAKRRGLTCGVDEDKSIQVVTESSVGNILAGWPDKKICEWAMTRDGWEKNRAFQKYVTEAKLRGLNCGGVQRGELAPKNPLSTSNILAGWTNEKSVSLPFCMERGKQGFSKARYRSQTPGSDLWHK